MGSNRHCIISISCAILRTGLDLKGSAKMRGAALVGKIDIGILANILLLVDFLKGTAVTFKK